MARAAAQKELTAIEHLQELLFRLLGSVVIIFIGGAVAYVFRLPIIRFLQRPLHEQLYYNTPMGSFQFVMQICLLVGIIAALPILIYNLLRFIEPAFEKTFSRKFVLIILGSSLLLAAAGILFAYFLTLPFALKFFNSVGTSMLHPLITANNYFGFILGYLATFAIVFQLPLLLLFINHVKPFGPGGLTKWRKHVYIGAFAISLIMPSSPDPLSQVSLAIPIIALYELSVLLIWKVNKKKRRQSKAVTRAQIHAIQNKTRAELRPIPASMQQQTGISKLSESYSRQTQELNLPINFDDVLDEVADDSSVVQPQPSTGQPIIDMVNHPPKPAHRTVSRPRVKRRDYQRLLPRRSYDANQPVGQPQVISDFI